MGHYCWVCAAQKPHEQFTGKGHTRHICRACARLPKDRVATLAASMEVHGFMAQSNISKKNVERLLALLTSTDAGLVAYCQLVLHVAQVAPRRRGRFKLLSSKHPALLAQLMEAGLVHPDWAGLDERLETASPESPDVAQEPDRTPPMPDVGDDIPF